MKFHYSRLRPILSPRSGKVNIKGVVAIRDAARS